MGLCFGASYLLFLFANSFCLSGIHWGGVRLGAFRRGNGGVEGGRRSSRRQGSQGVGGGLNLGGRFAKKPQQGYFQVAAPVFLFRKPKPNPKSPYMLQLSYLETQNPKAYRHRTGLLFAESLGRLVLCTMAS